MNPFFSSGNFLLGPLFHWMWLPLIIGFALWIWAVIDCAKRSFKNRYEKAVWLIAFVALPVPSVIAYLLVFKAAKSEGVMG